MKCAYVLPEKVLTNAELAAIYEGWSAEKILAKTGISLRHVADENETAVDLAEKAARKLFGMGVDPKSIDYILLCTQSPDYKLPSSACILQDRLGIPTSSGALDFGLGCSGFIYGLSLAKGLILGKMAKNVLLLTADTYSKYVHPMDKSVRTIFGDGATATLVDCSMAERIGDFVFGTDGSGADKLIVRTGGARMPVKRQGEEVCEQIDASGNVRTCDNIYMNGPEIFNFTLEVVPQTIREICNRNRIDQQDVDFYVFHQANKFMLDTIRKVNFLPRDKFYVNLEDTGNTVSSTIPIALKRAEAEEKLKPGMKVMILGFGVGLSWGGTIISM